MTRQAIDTEKRGYIEADVMRELLVTKGTPFREKEIEGANTWVLVHLCVELSFEYKCACRKLTTIDRDGVARRIPRCSKGPTDWSHLLRRLHRSADAGARPKARLIFACHGDTTVAKLLNAHAVTATWTHVQL